MESLIAALDSFRAKNPFNAKIIGTDRQDEIPKPPPLPKYDPNEEAPMWNRERSRFGIKVDTSSWPRIGDVPTEDDKPDWRGVVKKNINVIPMPDVYKMSRYNDRNYFWFDTPDYADPFKKLWYATKWFGQFGLALACFKAGLVDRAPFTTANNLYYLRTFWAPWFAATMAGSAAVITLANLRGKKDDCYNYAVGGFITASLLGRKHYTTWFWSVCAFTPIPVYLKYAAETNGHVAMLQNFRIQNYSMSGNSADHGVESGDLRLGLRLSHGDPGRGTRKLY